MPLRNKEILLEFSSDDTAWIIKERDTGRIIGEIDPKDSMKILYPAFMREEDCEKFRALCYQWYEQLDGVALDSVRENLHKLVTFTVEESGSKKSCQVNLITPHESFFIFETWGPTLRPLGF